MQTETPSAPVMPADEVLASEGQAMHAASFVLAVVPVVIYLPIAQSVHTVAPALELYLPAVQSTQDPEAKYFPASQSHELDPAELDDPNGQVLHALSPVAGLKEFAAHITHALALLVLP